MKKTNQYKPLTYNQFLYFVLALLLIFAALAAVLVLLNNRVSKLETSLNLTYPISKTSASTSQSSEATSDSLLPVCQQKNTFESVDSGPGDTILTYDGSDITVSEQTGVVFHICSNVKVYDIVSGKLVGQSALKVGDHILFDANTGLWITEIRIVSQ